MADEYKRLLDWAKQTNRHLSVSQTVSGWAIRVEINSPVRFKARGSGADINEAAIVATRQLESASAGHLEEIGEDPTPFGNLSLALARYRSRADT